LCRKTVALRGEQKCYLANSCFLHEKLSQSEILRANNAGQKRRNPSPGKPVNRGPKMILITQSVKIAFSPGFQWLQYHSPFSFTFHQPKSKTNLLGLRETQQ
jgi:hypothetical protein